MALGEPPDPLYYRFRRLLGLNDYEARALLALVRLGRAKPLTIATESGVPTGRIYDVLRMLELKGLVTRQGSEYVLADPRKSLARLAEEALVKARARAREIMGLAEELEELAPSTSEEEVRILYGIDKSVSAAIAAMAGCSEPPYFTVYKAVEKLAEYWPLISALIERLPQGTRILVHRIPSEALDALDQVSEQGALVAVHPGVMMDVMVACDTVVIGVPSRAHGAVSILVVNRVFAQGLRERLEEMWREAQPL